MTHGLIELFFFGTKFLLAIILLLFFLIGIIAIITRGREKSNGQLEIKHLNKKFAEIKDNFQSEILSTTEYKKIHKDKKKLAKQQKKNNQELRLKRIFLLDFQGDVKGSAVNHLREEITAILNIATPNDHVMIKIESGGGMVHSYGLAASQLARIREKNIPLTAIIDKVAASGGYLMACVANEIIAAPFSIIGSIGVILQLPNFNRLLKEKNIDFEQLTAGNFKRTLTIFGENTEEGRAKMREELEAIHQQFKNLVLHYRPQIEINKVATGEHWSGLEAQKLNLVDTLQTSDDWILEKISAAELYEVSVKKQKTLAEKLFSSVKSAKLNLLNTDIYTSWI